MVAKEVFANYYNFYSIWVQHAEVQVKNTGTQVKIGYRQVSYKIYSEPGLEPEPQFGFAAPRSRSRKKYFRLRNTGGNCKHV
jgi:hypothetical protein